MQRVELADVRVLVTGGRGFLGRHVARLAALRGADVVAVGRDAGDLRDPAQADRLLADVRPRYVLHCAVDGGGIGWMRAHPVESGRDNALINIHALEASHRHGVEVFVGAGSACAYPRICPVPFREEMLWEGRPEPTNAAYASSKRLLMELGRAYFDQHGFRAVFPMLANLYGPEDHLEPERAHVVAALIQRCLANPAELVVWGTGRATREHLYVADAADGLLAMLSWPSPDPVNIGTGVEVSVAELATEIAAACGYAGPVRFDATQPDGQPRKCLDVTRARERLGWSAPTALAEGLRDTVAWYREALCVAP